MILFIDIYKAYDHVIREKLYDLLSFIGIDFKYVTLYKIMTTNMEIYIEENAKIQYSNGIPQGSCISPMLFNIYYEQALKTISPFSDLILAFADDLAIIKSEVNNLTKVIINLRKWNTDYNLKINDSKTEVMLLNMDKPIYINYAHCKKYKYLGIIIENDKEKLRKESIIKRIKEICNKLKGMYLKNCVSKVSKLSVIWWMLSIILYHHISDVHCDFIKATDLEHHLIICIKKILGIKNNVKHLFVTGYFGLNLQNTIEKMLSKIYKFNTTSEKEINEIDKIKELQNWNFMLDKLNFNLNSIYFVMQDKWWDKNNKHNFKCNKCQKYISLKHIIIKHIEFIEKEKLEQIKWIINLNVDYNFAKAAYEIKGEKRIVRNWIFSAFKYSLEIKEKAINEFCK